MAAREHLREQREGLDLWEAVSMVHRWVRWWGIALRTISHLLSQQQAFAGVPCLLVQRLQQRLGAASGGGIAARLAAYWYNCLVHLPQISSAQEWL